MQQVADPNETSLIEHNDAGPADKRYRLRRLYKHDLWGDASVLQKDFRKIAFLQKCPSCLSYRRFVNYLLLCLLF